jgi:hypothetical protein
LIRAGDEPRVLTAIENHLRASYARVLASYPDEQPRSIRPAALVSPAQSAQA